MKMSLQVSGQTFTATMSSTRTAEALIQELENGPLTLSLHEYGGFEKVGPLSRSFPTEDRQITTRPGDIVLYQGNQLVLFYGSNSWSYTKLGHIDDLTGWEEALRNGDVTVTLSTEE